MISIYQVVASSSNTYYRGQKTDMLGVGMTSAALREKGDVATQPSTSVEATPQ